MNQVASGQSIAVKANGVQIALFNIDGQLHAVDNTCTHSGGPLGEGRLTCTVVTCPWHGAQFDVTTGECQAAPATTDVTTYPVQVEDGAVFVKL